MTRRSVGSMIFGVLASLGVVKARSKGVGGWSKPREIISYVAPGSTIITPGNPRGRRIPASRHSLVIWDPKVTNRPLRYPPFQPPTVGRIGYMSAILDLHLKAHNEEVPKEVRDRLVGDWEYMFVDE